MLVRAPDWLDAVGRAPPQGGVHLEIVDFEYSVFRMPYSIHDQDEKFKSNCVVPLKAWEIPASIGHWDLSRAVCFVPVSGKGERATRVT